jgi:hypothetical protein
MLLGVDVVWLLHVSKMASQCGECKNSILREFCVKHHADVFRVPAPGWSAPPVSTIRRPIPDGTPQSGTRAVRGAEIVRSSMALRDKENGCRPLTREQKG